MAMQSCTDNDLITQDIEVGQPDDELEEIAKGGYSLSVAVTLDNMGDNMYGYNELQYWENYIDPEKCRVLFFDEDDLFLFESKSRYIKQLAGGGNQDRWLVSVPLYTLGNDYYYDNQKTEYDWENIRLKITGGPFKIAILANRPEIDYYPDYENGGELGSHFFENRGPFWGPDDSGVKNIFDLHHSQYDPIYKGKSTSAGYYDFIMSGWNTNRTWESQWDTDDSNFAPTLSSTSSWVYHDRAIKLNVDDDAKQQDRRYAALPSADRPIPMYGVQRFDPIPEPLWEKGTTFNLSDNIPGGYNKPGYTGTNNISLLRSVVRLDLRVPRASASSTTDKPKFVALAYTNVNSRCEPLNVWSPTDSLWNAMHASANMDGNLCHDMKVLRDHGPTIHDNNTSSTGVDAYRDQMGWYYSAWKAEKNWNFNGKTMSGLLTDKKQYPWIINSCIQRNALVLCYLQSGGEFPASFHPEWSECDKTDLINDGYYHFVCYMGERNLVDPSSLGKNASGAGNTTAVYWMLEYKGSIYAVPICDLSDSNHPALASTITRNSYVKGRIPIEVNTQLSTWMESVRGRKNPKYYPWALVRNHIYEITLKSKTGKGADGEPEISFGSRDAFTKQIGTKQSF